MTELYKDPDPELLADLVDSWAEAAMKKQLSGLGYAREIAKTTLEWAAPILRQQGADQELEACVDWLDDTDCEDPQEASLRLRWHRRPKPPSRKEQALEAIGRLCASVIHDDLKNDAATIRRALEQLPDAL